MSDREPLPRPGPALDRWIRDLRGAKLPADPSRPAGVFVESEPAAGGGVVDVTTVILTNRECPFTCLMCDLWKRTTDEPVPPGSIVEQVRWALAGAGPGPRRVKLYNAGSFFDAGAVPAADLRGVAEQVARFERVVVESHPAFAGRACASFQERLEGRLEVAMGLETADEGVLARLNKRMNLEGFGRAARFLRSAGIAIRAFVLIGPPFVAADDTVLSALRSVAFALEQGAETVVLIPTRGGNGALDRLQQLGLFSPPSLQSIDETFDRALETLAGPGRMILLDTWGLERSLACGRCREKRLHRFSSMNLGQAVLPRATCVCSAGA